MAKQYSDGDTLGHGFGIDTIEQNYSVQYNSVHHTHQEGSVRSAALEPSVEIHERSGPLLIERGTRGVCKKVTIADATVAGNNGVPVPTGSEDTRTNEASFLEVNDRQLMQMFDFPTPPTTTHNGNSLEYNNLELVIPFCSFEGPESSSVTLGYFDLNFNGQLNWTRSHQLNITNVFSFYHRAGSLFGAYKRIDTCSGEKMSPNEDSQNYWDGIEPSRAKPRRNSSRCFEEFFVESGLHTANDSFQQNNQDEDSSDDSSSDNNLDGRSNQHCKRLKSKPYSIGNCLLDFNFRPKPLDRGRPAPLLCSACSTSTTTTFVDKLATGLDEWQHKFVFTKPLNKEHDILIFFQLKSKIFPLGLEQRNRNFDLKVTVGEEANNVYFLHPKVSATSPCNTRSSKRRKMELMDLNIYTMACNETNMVVHKNFSLDTPIYITLGSEKFCVHLVECNLIELATYPHNCSIKEYFLTKCPSSGEYMQYLTCDDDVSEVQTPAGRFSRLHTRSSWSYAHFDKLLAYALVNNSRLMCNLFLGHGGTKKGICKHGEVLYSKRLVKPFLAKDNRVFLYEKYFRFQVNFVLD